MPPKYLELNKLKITPLQQGQLMQYTAWRVKLTEYLLMPAETKTMQINKNPLNYKGSYKFSVNKTCESPGTYCILKDYFLGIKMVWIYDTLLIFKTAFLEWFVNFGIACCLNCKLQRYVIATH